MIGITAQGQPSNKKALWAFILIVPFLTELLSGNTPMTLFINPVGFLFFIIAYSFPALIIRELFIKWQLGLIGLFVLGLAYGVFNEGVAARTILQTDAMLSFHNYNTFGFNIPWALLIVPWHAFFSIIYPLLLIHTIYPDEAGKSWLSKRTFIIIGGVAAILGSLGFFGIGKFPPSPPIYLAACWLLVIFFVYLAPRVPRGPTVVFARDDRADQRVKFFFIGTLIAFVQILSFAWGELRFPLVAHLLLVGVPYVLLILFIAKKISVSGRIISLIGIGHYCVWALLMIINIGPSAGPVNIFGIVVVWGLLCLLWRSSRGT